MKQKLVILTSVGVALVMAFSFVFAAGAEPVSVICLHKQSFAFDLNRGVVTIELRRHYEPILPIPGVKWMAASPGRRRTRAGVSSGEHIKTWPGHTRSSGYGSRSGPGC